MNHTRKIIIGAGVLAVLLLVGLVSCQSAKKAPDTRSNPGTEAIETEQPTKNAAPTTEATQNGKTETEPTTEGVSASTEPVPETAGTEEPGTDSAATTELVTEPSEPVTEPTQPTKPSESKPTDPKPTEPKPTNPTEPPHTHSYTGTVTKSPTCTASGTKTYTCSCGKSYTETIPALGHNWGSWTTDGGVCGGTETRTCSRCGAKDSRDSEGGGYHTWDVGRVTKDPTCHTEGVLTCTCVRCGATQDFPLPPNEFLHNYQQVTAPTCTNNGTETCSVCHKTRSVNALGHDWEYHPAETETVYVYACYCGARFYSVTDWEAHFYSYLDTEEEDNHGGFQTWSEEHVIKPAYNKCKRCGMENPA